MKYINVQQQRQYTASRNVLHRSPSSCDVTDDLWNFYLTFFDDFFFPHSSQSWQLSVPTIRVFSFYFLRLSLKEESQHCPKPYAPGDTLKREREKTDKNDYC